MPKRRKYGSKEQHHFINGNYVFLAFCFVLYQILSSVFSLPILIGFFFCYMFILLKERDFTLYDLDFRWYFSLGYLLFIDITHDFYLFSSWIAFFIFYYFCSDWIKINFKIGKMLAVFFTLCAYLLLYILNSVLSYVDDSKLNIFGIEYLIYALIESAFCFLFFKDKLRWECV